MKLTVENTVGKKVKIFDPMDKEIQLVRAYDTQTCEVTFIPVYMTSEGVATPFTEKTEDGNNVIKEVTTVWKGSYAVVDGVRIERDYCGAV